VRRTLLLISLFTSACSPGRRQPDAASGVPSDCAAPVFLVHGPGVNQPDTTLVDVGWNGAEHSDTVDVVVPTSAAAFDSTKLLGQVAPLGVGEDSLPWLVPLDTGAKWEPVPHALLERPRATPGWRALGTVHVHALADWSRSTSGGKRLIVGVAVLAWCNGTALRTDLSIWIPD
jgi:hypothetical protein